ncbi:MAG: UTP--glucose-1-phosphate uridylyltransferase [Myxococcales bacterium]
MPIELRDALDQQLPAALRQQLTQHGFDQERLVTLASSLRTSAPSVRRDLRNRIRGPVFAPTPDEIPPVPPPDSRDARRLTAIGQGMLRRGEVAFCVMAGGMATRMGGVVKALVEAFDGRTFLALRLAENNYWSVRAGIPVPLWLMTSDATQPGIASALAKAPSHVRTFEQDLSVRLTSEGGLFLEDDGSPSTYATGHGDLPDALRRSGLLDAFRARGGKVVWITNLDNLGATIDPVILGSFVEARRPVMVEVCEKAPGDRGGIPVHAERHLQVLEEFRLPKDFDASEVPVFNTNTFLVEAEALATASISWNWFEVEKTVEGRVAIQFERLLQELTGALPSAYLTVPREGEESRFLPVKDFDELTRRRSTIELVARARGMLPARSNRTSEPS